MDDTYSMVTKLLEGMDLAGEEFRMSVMKYFFAEHAVFLIVNVAFLFLFISLCMKFNDYFNIMDNTKSLLEGLKKKDEGKEQKKDGDGEKKLKHKYKKVIGEDADIDLHAIWDNFVLFMKSDGAWQKLLSFCIVIREVTWGFIMVKNIIEHLIGASQCILSPDKILVDYLTNLLH